MSNKWPIRDVSTSAGQGNHRAQLSRETGSIYHLQTVEGPGFRRALQTRRRSA